MKFEESKTRYVFMYQATRAINITEFNSVLTCIHQLRSVRGLGVVAEHNDCSLPQK